MWKFEDNSLYLQRQVMLWALLRECEYLNFINNLLTVIYRKAYVGEATSVSKEELVKVVKTYFHCSSKEALYIIGVARRKKIVDIADGKVSLL